MSEDKKTIEVDGEFLCAVRDELEHMLIKLSNEFGWYDDMGLEKAIEEGREPLIARLRQLCQGQ